MQTLKVTCKQRNYEVIVGNNLLKDAGEILAKIFPPCSAVIVTDDIVDSLYGDDVAFSLTCAGFNTSKFIFKNGEQSKNLSVYAKLLEFLAQNAINRSDIVIALGGGVTGDLAGFAAATYMRGIQFVQMPTTLLAAIDSSVGGKTGVNLEAGKNLAGAFWQPSFVLCDCDTLKTLPEDILADGIAEAVKYGMIRDRELFEMLESGVFFDNPKIVIARCVGIKGEIVAKDELDTGERQLLNFGHTLAHAIEKLSGYKISHGHAVAIGMTIITRAAESMNLVKEPCLKRLIGVLKKYGLPVKCPYEIFDLVRIAALDKKRSGNAINFIIPLRIGESGILKLPVQEIESFIKCGLHGEE